MSENRLRIGVVQGGGRSSSQREIETK